MPQRMLIQSWTKIDRLAIDNIIKISYIIYINQTEVAMSDNKITITLSDSAIIQIAKLLSETTPTGTPINPLAMLGALGGLPLPPPKPEEVKEEKPTIGFKTK